MQPTLPEFKSLLEGLTADTGYVTVGAAFLAFNILLWSACWACSTAEKRAHSPILGFILGLALPIVYPIYTYFMLKPASVAKAEKHEKEKKKSEQGQLKDEDIFGDSDLDIGPGYFRKIYRDENGIPDGPFTIELESNMIVAETIAEVHDDFIVIVSKTNEEQTQRLRLPYSEIQNCTKD